MGARFATYDVTNTTNSTIAQNAESQPDRMASWAWAVKGGTTACKAGMSQSSAKPPPIALVATASR